MPEPTDPISPMSASPARVLVIDDEPQIRKFLDISLRAQGYRVVLAANAQEALVSLATQGADMVILDIGLPDKDGHEVLKELRQWSQVDRKSTRLNSSHSTLSRMPSSA